MMLGFEIRDCVRESRKRERVYECDPRTVSRSGLIIKVFQTLQLEP